MTGADVVRAARGWIGTRWQHQASVRGVACDCVGLVRGVMADLGAPVPASLVYDRHPDGVTLMQMAEEWLQPVPAAQLAPGHVVVFALNTAPSHVGIVADYFAGGLSLVHAHLPARGVVENRLDDLWLSRVRGVFIIPGVA